MTKLFAFDGLKRVEVQSATAGDIVCLAGIEDINIGETIADPEHRMAMPPIAVDEPTVSMIFGINTSPMAGREGQYVTSRHLRERLDKELLGNVSLKVEPTATPEQFKVLGRGELQLAILIEMMRREGFELQVSRPEIVTKEIDGKRMEPVEDLVIDVAEEFQGVVISMCGTRRGTMTRWSTTAAAACASSSGFPARGLIGFRSQFLTDTKGTGIMNHIFAGWEPWAGPIPARATGVLVSDRAGVATAYAMASLQERGVHADRAADDGLRGHDHRRALAHQRSRREHLQGEEADQHARVLGRRGHPHRAAPPARAGTGDRVHQRRRARRSDAEVASACASACSPRTCVRGRKNSAHLRRPPMMPRSARHGDKSHL